MLGWCTWLLIRPSATSIRLDVVTTQVSLGTTPEAINHLFRGVEAQKLFLSTFGRIYLGSGRLAVTPSYAQTGPNNWIEVEEGGTAEISPATISFVDAPQSEGAVGVVLSSSENGSHALRVALSSVASMQLDPRKTFTITCSRCRSTQALPNNGSMTFTSADSLGHGIQVFARDNSLRFRLELSSDDNFRLTSVPSWVTSTSNNQERIVRAQPCAVERFQWLMFLIGNWKLVLRNCYTSEILVNF